MMGGVGSVLGWKGLLGSWKELECEKKNEFGIKRFMGGYSNGRHWLYRIELKQ